MNVDPTTTAEITRNAAARVIFRRVVRARWRSSRPTMTPTIDHDRRIRSGRDVDGSVAGAWVVTRELNTFCPPQG